jgi:hypothetical protein
MNWWLMLAFRETSSPVSREIDILHGNSFRRNSRMDWRVNGNLSTYDLNGQLFVLVVIEISYLGVMPGTCESCLKWVQNIKWQTTKTTFREIRHLFSRWRFNRRVVLAFS